MPDSLKHRKVTLGLFPIEEHNILQHLLEFSKPSKIQVSSYDLAQRDKQQDVILKIQKYRVGWKQ